jgi:hypothetical protein
MKRKKYILFIVILFALKFFSIKAQEVEIQINPLEIINDQIIGFGWNAHPHNTPNKGTPALDTYFKYFLETDQSWMRMIWPNAEWESENDDDDPWTRPSDFSGFEWNIKGSLDWRIHYMLDQCEQNDIHVEINNWSTLDKQWINHTLDSNGFVTEIEAQNKAEEFGENIAALLYYLKTEANNGKGYDCVKYYAIWNEPGGGYEGHDFITFDYPGYHNLLYNQVKAHLDYYDEIEGTNITQELASMGLENHPTWRNSKYGGVGGWDNLIGEGVLQYLESPNGMPGEITNWPSADSSIDFISIHDYNSGFDHDKYSPQEHNQGTIAERLLPHVVKLALDQIADYDIDGQIEPLLFNEIGAHYIATENDLPQFKHGLYTVEALTRSANIGLSGGSMWNLNNHKFFAAISYPGCWWGETEPKGVVHPIPENYYPYKLLCQAMKRGDTIVGTTVTGGSDNSKGDQTFTVPETQRVWASAIINDHETKIIVINDSYNSKSIGINCSGIPQTGQKQFVSASKYGWIRSEIIRVSDNVITDNIEPRSITLYKFPGDTTATQMERHLSDSKIKVYPNPFRNQVTIDFTCSKSINHGSVKIYNPLGQVVKILVDHASFETGNHRIQWDGTNVENMPLPSGMYVVVLQLDSFIQSRIVSLLK